MNRSTACAGFVSAWTENNLQDPLRGELFSTERLRAHAIQLASVLQISTQPDIDRQFYERFQQSARQLRAANDCISRAVRAGAPLTPDAEWLLDNFYLVEEHLHEIQQDLPPGYFCELPKLPGGRPRTFQLAVELIVHTDSVIQRDDLKDFVQEFQGVAPLSIGELWSLPIMLRISLVENLRRLANQMVQNLSDRSLVHDALHSWQPGTSLPTCLQTDHPSPHVIAQAFAIEGELFPDDLAWTSALEHALRDRFPTSTELIRAEHRRQAANQVSIGNAITSLRLISALDWGTFFEETSLVEQALRDDPAGIYAAMDPETRDRYRHAVEDLAKGSRRDELDVMQHVAALTSAASMQKATEPLGGHYGYWLVDHGRRRLEQELGYRPKSSERVTRWMQNHPRLSYFGMVGGLLSAGLMLLAVPLSAAGTSWLTICLLLLLAAIPLSELAVSIANFLVTHLLLPRRLAKLEFKTGVSSEWRTMVVVPSLLTGRQEVLALLDRLEMHYVGNPEPHLRFALLTDFPDADREVQDSDSELVELAIAGIRKLNEKHGVNGRQPFYLFHRTRRFNPSEKCWMGWERKRGKLAEFNQLLCGSTSTSFEIQEGDLSMLQGTPEKPAFPFVITLDADTQLPLGAARKLIGALAHPLNRPQLDASGVRVVHGYSILQPRVSVQLGDGNKTWYTWLFANGKGIDPYATAASDMYQDLFGEGIFTGKGIYDVKSFEATLSCAFAENQILSHDLIEGCHARVALVSDIEVVDAYPTRYDADARRLHRWVRGDWQILTWLFQRVPCRDGYRRNRLFALSRWKILDNLRRSLVAPLLCLYLLASWFLVPTLSLWLSAVAWAVMSWPIIACLCSAVISLIPSFHWTSQLISIRTDFYRAVGQTLVQIACLPHRACLMLDAIGRTLVRLGVTRRKLLEWETAAATERRLSRSRWSIVGQMAFVPVAVAILVIFLPWTALPAAVPWLAAWFLSPWIAQSISEPLKVDRVEISQDDQVWLRLLARQTWSYFETFVNESTHWLPPDNFQEHPDDKVAERISPTNEGLFLASALLARDFGYLGLHSLIDLGEKNLRSWTKLPTLKGHFYNWYETSTLRALLPRYVSTVDSGNLAASLLVFRQGLDDVCQVPLFGESVWSGGRDTVAAALHACDDLQPRGARLVNEPLDQLIAALQQLQQRLQVNPGNWIDRRNLIHSLEATQSDLDAKCRSLAESLRHSTIDVERKINSLTTWVESIGLDFRQLTPWVEVDAAEQNSQMATGNSQPDSRQALQQKLEQAQSIDQLIRLPATVSSELAALRNSENQDWIDALRRAIDEGANAARKLMARALSLGQQAERLTWTMDFQFLYNPQRRLFSIGYNIEDGQLDRSHYDMLCSEARLSSHIAIAKGDVDYKHWFQLGRQRTLTAGQAGLLSWGGTMFEFLMPLLFQRSYDESLLDQACEAAVARQQEYGHQRGVPWGISESAFGALAINSDYHYQSFGVPGLGLKRGLSDDLVIAPYATMLALMVDPTAAIKNLRRLTEEGAYGRFGFYDAMDYTPIRVRPTRRAIPVRCYMAHHQAMSLLSIANVLLDRIVERRFDAHPAIRATDLLLQESVPSETPVLQPHSDETTTTSVVRPEEQLVSRRLIGYQSPAPRTHLLSNGAYSVMVTNTGGGFSRWSGNFVNRWKPDALNDDGGQFFYLRDTRTGRVWSATYQPTCAVPDSYEVTYSIDKAEYRRRDGDMETHLEIVVSPDSNVEVRQLKLTNHSFRPAELEITSYLELTLTPPAADWAHPAFQKLFVDTEYVAEETSLLARRRPRDAHAKELWGLHVLSCPDALDNSVEFESDRRAFLGRGRNSRIPAAMANGTKLTNSQGFVLDPVCSLRCRVQVPPHATVTVAFATGIAETRDEALQLADQFHEQRNVARAFEMAWVFNQVQLHHLHLSAAEAQRAQQLASLLLFPQTYARGPQNSLQKNRQGQSGLWRFGVSGDQPILLIKIADAESVRTVRDLLLAYEYWRHHGLFVDVVVLNTNPGSYLDELQERLQHVVQDTMRTSADLKHTVFLLRSANIAREDVWLLESAAQVVLDARRGWSVVKPQAADGDRNPRDVGRTWPVSPTTAVTRVAATNTSELQFWNGMGGFNAAGNEYVLQAGPQAKTPVPWSNVIANPRFGTLITERGGGYTWAGNSRQNKLTTWSNDPVCDPASEMLYLQNLESGEICWPLLEAVDGGDSVSVRHGFGYSRFTRRWHDIEQDITITIAPDDPVKFVMLKLKNRGVRPIQLAATYYAELVLGVGREQTQLHLTSEFDASAAALLFRNAYHPCYAEQVAFVKAIGPDPSYTADRKEFLGRQGDIREPDGIREGNALSQHTGVALDPCAVAQSRFTLAAGGTVEIVFLLGAGADPIETRTLLETYHSWESALRAAEETKSRWSEMLSAVQVRTPNPALDLLTNGWLVYQTLSCRLWGRSAFYQSGGAYGFRDQLQDVMALVYCRPDLAREQLLRAAARQFEPGDVQHWWHPPLGEGTRTRFSDDLLWLPFAAVHYLRVTGDDGVLDEMIPFLQSQPLAPHEQERYELPQVSDEQATLYEHCRRTLEYGFKLGPHGLPLIGCGDWNDGMNQIGEAGQGESVWMGWFLLVLLDQFLPVMEKRGDTELAEDFRQKAIQLRESMEAHAWDGGWYRRAYFDDGTPLGSQQNDECQIDSIAQSWAVLANADSDRTDQALKAVWSRLVDHEHRLVKLFTPAFDKTALNPGYIKGYLPGVRENGGQYTHAVLWLIQALVAKGDADRAMQIFDYVNPILHSNTADAAKQYRVEPYVMAADVYTTPSHYGMGGWSWYTGSASWTYRTALESILGFHQEGNRVSFRPCVPESWLEFDIVLRWGKSHWHFTIFPNSVPATRKAEQDGSIRQLSSSDSIVLTDDGRDHRVFVQIMAEQRVTESPGQQSTVATRIA